MIDLDRVLLAVTAGYLGDGHRAAAACTTDVRFHDHPMEPELVGAEAVRDYFADFAGVQAEFVVVDTVDAGERAAVAFTLLLGGGEARQGQAMVTIADGLLARWQGLWVETDAEPDDAAEPDPFEVWDEP